MFDDGKLGTVLAAAAAIFILFFIVFMWLFGWGFYISSALAAVAAVILIWWMGLEDAETLDETPPLTKSGTNAPGPAIASPLTAGAAVGAVAASEPEVVEPVKPDEPPADLELDKSDAPIDISPGRKPTLHAAPDGEPDDLKRIKGVGPKLEAMLNQMGVWHFHQIASWGDAEIAWVDENLEGFKGRISRDDWVGQAKELNGS